MAVRSFLGPFLVKGPDFDTQAKAAALSLPPSLLSRPRGEEMRKSGFSTFRSSECHLNETAAATASHFVSHLLQRRFAIDRFFFFSFLPNIDVVVVAVVARPSPPAPPSLRLQRQYSSRRTCCTAPDMTTTSGPAAAAAAVFLPRYRSSSWFASQPQLRRKDRHGPSFERPPQRPAAAACRGRSVGQKCLLLLFRRSPRRAPG